MMHFFKHQTASNERFGMRARALACRVVLMVGLAMLFLGMEKNAGAAEPTSKEHELKAAFLYNFTKFVEWPENSFADASAPFVIGVAGETPCAAQLELIARNRKVNGRTLVIKRLRSPESAKDVHLLFVSASEDARAEKWIASVRNTAALNVGESESFTTRGGAIGLLLEDDKVRFEINISVAEAAGLKVSAQLQKLAKVVRRK